MSTAQSDPPAVIGSPAGYLSAHDLKRAGTGAAIVMALAGLTYASHWAGQQDFGMYTPFILGGLYFLADTVRRFAKDTQVVPVSLLDLPISPATPPGPTTLPEHSPPPA